MKAKWIVAGIVAAAAAGGGVYAGIRYSNRDIVEVQTSRAAVQDLASVVTASGEIKPRNYINIGSNASGAARITDLLVVEGQQVKKGQLLAQLESVQSEAEVAAQQAQLASAQADAVAAEASLAAYDENIRTLQASADRARAQLEQAQISWARTEQMFEAKVISRADYDQNRVSVSAAEASLREAEARIPQARAQRAQVAAQLSGSQRRVAVSEANLQRAQDILRRTRAVSPIDGMVTNLPVRVGETVVPGVQNSPASTLMTIADMSLITAEVKVDETDIVNVRLDQDVEINIDAILDRTFHGRVIEIGNTAILRSTGQAASQSAVSSQEAKDFKVVIALTDPPAEVRPGLSCSVKVTTATRNDVLTIPIQALTVRQKADLEELPEGAVNPSKAGKEEITGVFVIADGVAVFRKLETGITGSTDVEILAGLQKGEEVITGSYKVIRTLRNRARVKVNNQAVVETTS